MYILPNLYVKLHRVQRCPGTLDLFIITLSGLKRTELEQISVSQG